ncbi:MAG: aldose 1-epimerase family protein [Rikenellaceae bacterium]
MATIENGELKLEINELGAELFSIRSVQTKHEYLWYGDPTFWKSRSPILFPIVGAICDNKCRIDGKEYTMKQHGIARHLEFETTQKSACEVICTLKSSEETKENYPYDFILEIGYRLEESKIIISYKVTNPSDEIIYFQLGAHPGFNFMNFDPETIVQGYFAFNDMAENGILSVSQLNKNGYLTPEKRNIELTDKMIAITKELFNVDALILEGDQSKDISLLDASKEAYIRVKYDAPVVGLWSKANNSYSPFTCIEPWYGRCDEADYTGEFKDKEWMQTLSPAESFNTSIIIEILK